MSPKTTDHTHTHRPASFDTFIGQKYIKKVLQTAILSCQKNQHPLGHILFAGPSGYGKTSLAHIVTHDMQSNFFGLTGYALTKPAEIISLLQKLQPNDIVFIDEIHRLRANLEEILYIAMEDYRIDMILPDGTELNMPVHPFTLIGATTKPESLTQPLKNRFLYHFHLSEYDDTEKQSIIVFHLDKVGIQTTTPVIHAIAAKTENTPRQIKNCCFRIRDFMIANNHPTLNMSVRQACQLRIDADDHGITPLHKKYLACLDQTTPTGINTLSAKLGINPKTIEQDIEPLLLKLNMIDRTPRGRVKN